MKMAVVGCEASGKTVFMCALADYYGRAAADNPMRLKLTPENAAANSFERYQFRQMRCLRQWPPATPPNRTIEVKWTLRRGGEPVVGIDMLEFGGETFRAAFREDAKDAVKQEASVRELTNYLASADFFVVLVSIKSLLADPAKTSETDYERETEALWVTRGILEFIRAKRPNAGVVIGLTQADKYRNELGEAGGAQQLFAERWPTIGAAAQGIPVVEVASVSKTDDSGNPAQDYKTHGILPVMQAFSKHCFGDENALESGAPVIRKPTKAKVPSLHGLFFALCVLIAGATVVGILRNAQVAEPVVLPTAVTNTVEKIVERQITNTVERIVEKPVAVTNTVRTVVERQITNTVEKIIEKPIAVTNTVERIVERAVTNTIEKIVEKPVAVTNMVEKIVEKPVAVTNTIEKIVEKTVTNTVEKIVEKSIAEAPNAATPLPVDPGSVTDAPLDVAPVQELEQTQFRDWTDHNGRKIFAKWVGVAGDQEGISLLTRTGRRIDAVIWKFDAKDQDYIRAEIKRRTARGEVLSDGVWLRNPLLRN